jgi:hypothetical protein
MDGGAVVYEGPIGGSVATGDDGADMGDDESRVCSCGRVGVDNRLAETVAIYREVFVNTFFEVLAQVEASYSDEIAQEAKPHREKLRVELAASLQTMQTVLNLTGLRLAEKLSPG